LDEGFFGGILTFLERQAEYSNVEKFVLVSEETGGSSGKENSQLYSIVCD